MTIYEKNVEKYNKLRNKYDIDIIESLDEIEKIKEKNTNLDKTAIVLFGYSSNGKTSYLNEVIGEHPYLKVISFDKEASKIIKENNIFPFTEQYLKELAARIGNEFEINLNSELIIDGNFLNLYTRMTLIDTLHELGYKVNLVDLRGQINDTLSNTIEKEYKEELNYKKTPIDKNELHNKIKRDIMNYNKLEIENNKILIQELYNLIDYNIENYYDFKTPIKDIVNDNNLKIK